MEKDFEKLNKDKTITETPKSDIKIQYKKEDFYFKKNQKIKNKNKKKELKKSKNNIKEKKVKKNLILNNSNNEENYSLELGNEEEEFDSDEYISSTMLDVETNTYINLIEKISNDSVSYINKKIYNKSPIKLENKNNKNYVKKFNLNNNEYLHKNNNNNSGISISSCKINKNNFSSSPKLDKKDILYKKLNIPKNITITEEKDNKSKTKKNLKVEFRNKEFDKNYSMRGYNSPLNIIYNKENLPKLDINNNNNLLYLFKNNNSEKNDNKIIKTKIKNLKNNFNTKSKINTNEKTSNIININNSKEREKYKKINKNIRKSILSPKYKKFNKILNTLNSIHNTEMLSPSLVNNIFISNYKNKKKLIKSNNTIISNSTSSNVNNTINFNNLNNNINNIRLSPLKNIKDKKSNRKITLSYNKKPFNSNSISIENNTNNSNNISSNIRISDKLLAYSFNDKSRTLKNKRNLYNRNKFLDLFLNKKKKKLLIGKDLNIHKIDLKNKNQIIQNKIINLKKLIDKKINIKNQNIQRKMLKLKIKNGNNLSKNSNLNSYINSYSNKKQNEKNIRSNHNLYKKDNNPKQFIYLKKENLYNIIKKVDKKKCNINPFNQESKNNIINNLSLSKSYQKYLNNGNNENRENEFNTNLTSININKNAKKKKKIKLEIGNIKKSNYRAKTLMEDDYIRDILINYKDNKKNDNDKFFKNYKSQSITLNLSPLNYKRKKNLYDKKNNYSPLIKNNITKNLSERQNINFNININMSNNNYKKVICYYHGHNNSSINYCSANKKEKNSNLSFNMEKQKNLNNLRESCKMNINETFNNNIISNYLNSGYINNIYNYSVKCPNSFNNNYNNIFGKYFGNNSSIINKKKNHNFFKNNIKQNTKINNNKNILKKINTYTYSDYKKSNFLKIKWNSNKRIKLSNNNSGIKNFNNKSNYIFSNDIKNKIKNI